MIRSCQPGLACLAATLCLALAGAAIAGAQVVANPRVVQFDPSPDHAAMISGSTPVVSNYVLEVYMFGAAAPFHTVDMGKLDPANDGKLYFDFGWQVAGWPLPTGTYESRVAAVGPQGTTRSPPSNPFTLTPPPASSSCAMTLSVPAIGAPAIGGGTTFTLTTGAWCNWTIYNPLNWVVLSATTGRGPALLGVAFAQNRASAQRVGQVNIGSANLTVLQIPPTTPSAPRQLRVVAR